MNPHPRSSTPPQPARSRAAFCALLLAAPAAVHAGPRASGSYTVPTETHDAGGGRSASPSYSNNGGLGGVTGLSTVAAPAQTAKHGYIAQLYDVTGLTLAAPATDFSENSAFQLSAWQTLDDSTRLPVPAASVAWSVLTGPVTGIGAGGLATAGTVYQNTPALVQGLYLGQTGNLNLTVLDSTADNFGSYAGDRMDDGWQVQYFGIGNPLAAALLDPDGDGQTNFFEFTAGLVPTDAASRFLLGIAPVPGQPGRKKLTFSPRLEDRTYVVKARPDLAAAPWTAITASAPADSGVERTVIDLGATPAAKFYRVEITKP